MLEMMMDLMYRKIVNLCEFMILVVQKLENTRKICYNSIDANTFAREVI